MEVIEIIHHIQAKEKIVRDINESIDQDKKSINNLTKFQAIEIKKNLNKKLSELVNQKFSISDCEKNISGILLNYFVKIQKDQYHQNEVYVMVHVKDPYINKQSLNQSEWSFHLVIGIDDNYGVWKED